MKLKLTTALLLAVLAIPNLYADELTGSAPAKQENKPSNKLRAITELLFAPETSHAPAPAVASEVTTAAIAGTQNLSDISTPASRPASKSPPTAATSTPARKVAKDYAPAQDLLLSAMSLIGVKYKWGGNTPESGLDCSGFIKYVFENTLNIALPRTALGMSRVGDDVDKEALKPGDLVFFNTLKRKFSHVGIYLGDNRFIHSPRSGKSVEVANMGDKYWTTRYDGARRMGELDNENIDVAALLENRPARVKARATAEPVPASNASCRKVTKVQKAKKVTTTVCSKPAKSSSVAKKAQKPAKAAVAAKTGSKKKTATAAKTSTAKKKTASNKTKKTS